MLCNNLRCTFHITIAVTAIYLKVGKPNFSHFKTGQIKVDPFPKPGPHLLFVIFKIFHGTT